MNCGISFSIWQNKIKDGSAHFFKYLEWTNWTGSKKTSTFSAHTFRNRTLFEEFNKPKGDKCLERFHKSLFHHEFLVPTQLESRHFFQKGSKWVLDLREDSVNIWKGTTVKALRPTCSSYFIMFQKWWPLSVASSNSQYSGLIMQATTSSWYIIVKKTNIQLQQKHYGFVEDKMCWRSM